MRRVVLNQFQPRETGDREQAQNIHPELAEEHDEETILKQLAQLAGLTQAPYPGNVMRTCPRTSSKVNLVPLYVDLELQHVVGYLDPTIMFGPILEVKPYKRPSSHGASAGISVMFEHVPITGAKALGKVWVNVTENTSALSNFQVEGRKKGVWGENDTDDEHADDND